MKKVIFRNFNHDRSGCSLILFAILFSSQALSTYADLYSPGAWMSEYGSGTTPIISSWTLGGEYQGDGAYLDMLVDISNPFLPVLTPDGGSVGISHSWYETSLDTVINEDFALNTLSFYGITGIGEIQTVLNQPFYMAFWLDSNGSDNPDAGDVYGWAELEWDGSNLNLLDSAAENDGIGIIAGQYQQVPEPATILLFGLGGLSAWVLRRNKRVQDI